MLLSACFPLCAQAQGSVDTNAIQLEQAQAGKMKWSDYYSECFNRMFNATEKSGVKLIKLNNFNKLIDYSLEYENGSISRSIFDYKRQRLQIIQSLQLEEALKNEDATRKGFHAETGGDIYPH